MHLACPTTPPPLGGWVVPGGDLTFILMPHPGDELLCQMPYPRVGIGWDLTFTPQICIHEYDYVENRIPQGWGTVEQYMYSYTGFVMPADCSVFVNYIKIKKISFKTSSFKKRHCLSWKMFNLFCLAASFRDGLHGFTLAMKVNKVVHTSCLRYSYSGGVTPLRENVKCNHRHTEWIQDFDYRAAPAPLPQKAPKRVCE